MTSVQAHDARARDTRGATLVRPFQVRGRFFTALALRLERSPDGQLLAALDAEVGRMSGLFQYAEGWRRHLHLGFGAADFDPIRTTLKERVLVAAGMVQSSTFKVQS